MRVLLAGASGAIGRLLVPRLRAAGHQVLALTRQPGGALGLRAAGATPIIADLLKLDGLLRAVDGQSADAVIHQATAISGIPLRHRDLAATDILRDIGTRHLLRVSRELGADRFVTQSFFLGYGWRDHGSEPVREDQPFGVADGGPFDDHLRSLRSNEDQVLGAGGVALRYGMFYGPDPMTRKLVRMASRRLLPAPTPPATVHPIHVDDAAAAAVAALRSGRRGQAYNIADEHPVRMDTFVDALASAAGAPRPIRVPSGLLRPMPYLHALMARVGVRLDTQRATDELGWQPIYRDCWAGLDGMT